MNMMAGIEAAPELDSVSRLLKDAREQRRYSFDDVAETSGLTVSEIAALESGKGKNSTHIARVAAALGVSISGIAR